ncbi:DUF6952 family protein [Flammeovirga kamogawensis]|uniref:Uncharacterized protein n=1 Tax=Flammeovirga kamogawensis TaxID=373891 RepID=A0ABX8GYQ1_9BACT|nr:hypothetical protein [Flammeovirga kamogawensis]MBB6459173.1 hypothetical protein [Flammeovirga kamogawensis]QWG08739.1 hypothetical protein KM029_07310 [Flammeovirga kamogawensis]TRX67032.1 hypothetical protein EO216_02355 [Flammeovirga kamogawensis]
MKIPIIKKLVENYSLQDLQAAEEALSEEQTPAIEIGGDDEGEQLTHAFAAVWIKEKVEAGEDFKVALRAYTSMVRGSIS